MNQQLELFNALLLVSDVEFVVFNYSLLPTHHDSLLKVINVSQTILRISLCLNALNVRTRRKQRIYFLFYWRRVKCESITVRSKLLHKKETCIKCGFYWQLFIFFKRNRGWNRMKWANSSEVFMRILLLLALTAFCCSSSDIFSMFD